MIASEITIQPRLKDAVEGNIQDSHSSRQVFVSFKSNMEVIHCNSKYLRIEDL